MQPYFLPYIGYYQLIHASDLFIVYDNIQFTKQSWINRNRILLNGKPMTFTLPVRKDTYTLNVNERFLADDSSKKIKTILGQIRSAYYMAPFFEKIYPVLEEIFCHKERNLFGYIYYSLLRTSEHLQMNLSKIKISSSVNIKHDALKFEEKVIAINKAVGSDIYLNPIGGEMLYNKETFRTQGVDLRFLRTGNIIYDQHHEDFVPSLSIIDVLMFNSPEEIKKMLGNYELV